MSSSSADATSRTALSAAGKEWKQARQAEPRLTAGLYAAIAQAVASGISEV